jgi:hypothetical protein
VVFFGFEPRTASRLMTSRLENLAGHYNISNTLVLRFLNLYHFSKDKAAVVKKFNNLLMRPYMSAGLTAKQAANFSSQLQHHLRFAVEYCVQREVVDITGAPTGLAQLVMHLHAHAPANFVFAGLLSDGTITRICTGSNKVETPRSISKMLDTLGLYQPSTPLTSPLSSHLSCSYMYCSLGPRMNLCPFFTFSLSPSPELGSRQPPASPRAHLLAPAPALRRHHQPPRERRTHALH